jgi:hypothetical protein
MAKHRTVYKKTKVDYLEEAEYQDDDLDEILWSKYVRAVELEGDRISKERLERYEQYFLPNAVCREHDTLGCGECRHYANGRCPSYWEELHD